MIKILQIKGYDSNSETTSGTMAFKVIEEVKNNQYNQKQFTVANG